MSSQNTASKDHWSAEAYNTYAPFVSSLSSTNPLISLLDPKPTDRVLDIGCGDGIFTAKFAADVKSVVGLDASQAMIQAAKGLELKAQSGDGSVSFDVVDCAGFSVGDDTAVQEGNFDKVVSNAALHWILRNPATRVETLRSIYRSLNPGGTFAFELGGHGNIAEMHTALLFGLKHYGGLSISEAEAASPWFFPSDVWMRSELEKLGFEVKECKLVHRPTFLEGGVEGWVRLMGANMIEVLEEGKREAFVKGVCEVLQSIVSREDGGKWLGYVRLRGVAVKK